MSDWRNRTRQPWLIDHFEVRLLLSVQRLLPWRAAVAVSKWLSFIAEHSLVWIIIAGAAALFDGEHRLLWVAVLAGTVISHGGATALKILVRRPRPSDPRVQLLGATMSKLSFPSSHSAGTTAFAIGAAIILPSLGWVAALLIIAMGVARMRLGVHYPTDVLAGVTIGVICALAGQMGSWLNLPV